MDGLIKTLTYIGMDGWDRPVYADEYGHLWKDVDPRKGFQRNSNICSATNNDFNGEPDSPISSIYGLQFVPERVTW